MNYRSATNYLNNYINFEVNPATAYAPEKFNLDRVHNLLKHIGSPHLQYPSVHIAGTKGKGSVASMTESVIRSSNHVTGLFTSPHLHDLRERIRVNGKIISKKSFVDLLVDLQSAIESTADITYYEIMTILAMEYFARQKVDIAILEVGLGGRLDATNIVTPTVCAITTISYDHMDLLGNTIMEIATEKAGIIKSGVPIVSGPQLDSALTILDEHASALKAPFIDTSKVWRWEHIDSDLSGQLFSIWRIGQNQHKVNQRIPLLGQHQIENVTVVMSIIEQLCQQGWDIPQSALNTGLTRVEWPARCEIFQSTPPILIDSSHNQASASQLTKVLEDLFPHQQRVLIFGAMSDKDVKGMFDELLPNCSHTVLTSTGMPRSMTPNELENIAADYSCSTTIQNNTENALNAAIKLAGDDGMIVVAGSIAIAASIRLSVTRKHPYATLHTSEQHYE